LTSGIDETNILHTYNLAEGETPRPIKTTLLAALTVCDGARIKHKLMVFMVYFQPVIVWHNSYTERRCIVGMWKYMYKHQTM
jgi:hypothetical protein